MPSAALTVTEYGKSKGPYYSEESIKRGLFGNYFCLATGYLSKSICVYYRIYSVLPLILDTPVIKL